MLNLCVFKHWYYILDWLKRIKFIFEKNEFILIFLVRGFVLSNLNCNINLKLHYKIRLLSKDIYIRRNETHIFGKYETFGSFSIETIIGARCGLKTLITEILNFEFTN